MLFLWRAWASNRAASRCAGELPDEAPQLDLVSFEGIQSWPELAYNTQTTGPFFDPFETGVAPPDPLV